MANKLLEQEKAYRKKRKLEDIEPFAHANDMIQTNNGTIESEEGKEEGLN